MHERPFAGLDGHAPVLAGGRLPIRTWLAIVAAFVVAYGFMFTFVHVRADMRPCVATLPDPFFALIPYDPRWFRVSHEVYYVFTFGGLAWLLRDALRGNHVPLARFGVGLSLQAALRCVTILLLPLCRATVTPGTVVLREAPLVDLGLVQIPWRAWATNDLVFSGHVGEFLLLFWATRHWPRWARVTLVGFQLLQAYALLATRGHYAIDIVLALPCAYLADSVAVALLARARARAARAPADLILADLAPAPTAAAPLLREPIVPPPDRSPAS